MTFDQIMQLINSMIWLLAGVGIFIVGMNFLGEALEKSAGAGMQKLLSKICKNRFSGVGVGAGVIVGLGVIVGTGPISTEPEHPAKRNAAAMAANPIIFSFLIYNTPFQSLPPAFR